MVLRINRNSVDREIVRPAIIDPAVLNRNEVARFEMCAANSGHGGFEKRALIWRGGDSIRYAKHATNLGSELLCAVFVRYIAHASYLGDFLSKRKNYFSSANSIAILCAMGLGKFGL